jgi:hypothetical protein
VFSNKFQLPPHFKDFPRDVAGIKGMGVEDDDFHCNESYFQIKIRIKITRDQLDAKIEISHTQLTRYERKDIQPPAEVHKRLPIVIDASIVYLVKGSISYKVKQTLRDAELIIQFRQLDHMPEEEKFILKVLGSLIRDINAGQAFTL